MVGCPLGLGGIPLLIIFSLKNLWLALFQFFIFMHNYLRFDQ